jgi:hypothetical protein
MLSTPYLALLHRTYFASLSPEAWCESMIDELVVSGAAKRQSDIIWDR